MILHHSGKDGARPFSEPKGRTPLCDANSKKVLLGFLESFKASFISFRGACVAPELVGYARVSTRDEQAAGLEHQIAQLKALGVADENLFVERASAVGERPVLEEALRFVRRGDIFVVCKLDRLARSIRNLSTIADDLKRRKVALRILDLGIDTSTASGLHNLSFCS
jgi:hypothetical protein